MKKVSPALFVSLYMESHAAGHTMVQFAARIGVAYLTARSRVAYYKRRGVRLPALRDGRGGRRCPGLAVGELNAIVESASRERGSRSRLNGSPVVLAR